MDQPTPPDPEARYRAFLRTRWPDRAHRLGTYAFFGSLLFAAFDALMSRQAAAPAPLALILAARLPWMAIPVTAWLVIRRAPAWRGLPALATALSIAWTWGNALGYFVLDLAGTPLQAIALLLCFITAATFLPLRWHARAAVFAAMALGQLALDLTWPLPGSPAPRLIADAALFAVAFALVVVFENFADSQRRGLALRHHLEETVAALRASRARAEAAARAVGQLAAQVAHDVNNPLSAVKVNVRWLAEAPPGEGHDAERAEVLEDALGAVERISRIVADLKRQAAHDPDAAGPAAPGEAKPDA